MKINFSSSKTAVITLLVVGISLFFISFYNGFVIDDMEIVAGSTVVHSISNIPKFFHGGAFPRGSSIALQGQYYRPLMLTFFSAIYTASNGNPSYFHFFQVLIFIFNAVLVYFLLKEFLKPAISLVLSLIFIVHPMNLLPAIFVASAGDTLFMMFGLLAILLVKKSSKLGIGKLVVLGFLLLSSVLSKEAGVLFFVLSVLTTFFYQKKNLLKVLATGFITSAVYLYLRMVVAKTALVTGNFAPIQKASVFEKIISTPKILSYYITSLVFPQNLSMFQHWVVNIPGLTNFVLPVVILVSFVCLVIYLARKTVKKDRVNSKDFIFFLLWLSIGIALLIPFFPLDMTVSDRWFYFPFVGLLGLLGVVWEDLNLKSTTFIKTIVCLGIVLLSVRSFVRIQNWKSNLTLASADIKYNSDSFETQNLYGIELAISGNLKDGETHLKKSVDLLPYGVNLTNLGTVYLAEGNIDLALTTFEKAAGFHYYKAYEDIAGILLFHRTAQETVIQTSSFLKVYPTDPKLWYILSLAELKMGDRQRAIYAAKKYSDLVGNSQAFNYFVLVTNGATFNQLVAPSK